MKKIQEVLEEEITRGNCHTCPKRRYVEADVLPYYECTVTEEIIGSGNEYCELKEIN